MLWPCNQDVIMNKALSNNVIWLLVAGYLLWVLADSFFHPGSTGVSATVNVFFVIAIATLHGLRRYSLKEFLIFFVIAFIVSNFYENLSILTGFPFGHYHYTEALGPKLFLVPLLIAPAYFGCGYLAWSEARRGYGEQRTEPVAEVERCPHQDPEQNQRHDRDYNLESATCTARLAVASKNLCPYPRVRDCRSDVSGMLNIFQNRFLSWRNRPS